MTFDSPLDFMVFIFNWPMMFYSIPLSLALFYWLIVIFGAVDIDFLDGGADGVLEGGAEGALEGGAEGAVDGVAEGALDGVADGALDGVAEGALDGMADGAADGVLDGAVDGGMEGSLENAARAASGVNQGPSQHSIAAAGDGPDNSSVLGPILRFLHFGSTPATIVLSFILLFMWIAAAVSYMYLVNFVPDDFPRPLLFCAILAASLVCGIIMTHFAAWPFRGLLHNTTRHSGNYLIGKSCRILSSKVTSTFGRAEVRTGAAPLILDVICEGDNTDMITKGDEVFITYYDRQRSRYVVSPRFGGKASNQ